MTTFVGETMGVPSRHSPSLSGKTHCQIRQKRLSKVTKAGVDNDGIQRFFRSLFPENTAAEIAAVTGISVNTINNVLHRKSGMGAGSLIICAAIFGPDFLAAAMPFKPTWLDRAMNMEHRLQVEQERAALEAQLRAFNGEGA